MELNMIFALAGGLAVLGVLVAVVLLKNRTAYLGPVKEELQKEKMWLRRGEYNAAMVRGRQNLELLLKLVAEKNGIQLDNSAQAVATAKEEAERQSQNGQNHRKGRSKEKKVMTYQQFNRWLSDNGYLDRVAKWEMNQVRMIGNKAVHENHADKEDAWNQYNYLEDILKTVTEKSQNPKKHHERQREAEKAKNEQKDKTKSKPKKHADSKAKAESKEKPKEKSKTKEKSKSKHETKEKREAEAKVVADAKTEAIVETSGEDVTKKKRRRRRKKKPQSAEGAVNVEVTVNGTEAVSKDKAKPKTKDKSKSKHEAKEKHEAEAVAEAKSEAVAEAAAEEAVKKKRRRRRRRKPQSQENGTAASNNVVPEDKNEGI